MLQPIRAPPTRRRALLELGGRTHGGESWHHTVDSQGKQGPWGSAVGRERARLLENYEWCEVGAGTQVKGGC